MTPDTHTRLKSIRARVEKQEGWGWITKGSAIFETNTCSGKILWPSQREAYIAGYGEGLASMLPEARFLLDLCDKQTRALEIAVNLLKAGIEIGPLRRLETLTAIDEALK